MRTLEVQTPQGLARAHVRAPHAPRAWLVLGHGAGGGVHAPDLQAAAQEAERLGLAVALVEQPYRVAGRKAPPRAPVLDEAWTAVVAALPLDGRPLVTGGRSSGARVACRTAAATGAAGVLCLAFPLTARLSRQPELDAVEVPVLVVQGVGDRFGMPGPGPRREVVQLKGDHGLKSDMPGLRDAVRRWLAAFVD